MCGESVHYHRSLLLLWGPSPRVRGILVGRPLAVGGGGSIPACAGNPLTDTLAGLALGVHPRVCGESAVIGRHRKPRRGPSPRVRGIRLERAAHDHPLGSIPACAGNPSRRAPKARSTRVHPRVCGESRRVPLRGRAPGGPSPRVRGILYRGRRGRAGSGSIPACAGNPAGVGIDPREHWVHPRVCGES